MLRSLKVWAKQLKKQIFALYYAYRDTRTPRYAKLISACVVAYAFSPIDLIPDFIPVLGYLDDLILVPLGVKFALRMIPPSVLEEARAKADAKAAENKPRNWVAASLIIVLWISVMLALYWVVF